MVPSADSFAGDPDCGAESLNPRARVLRTKPRNEAFAPALIDDPYSERRDDEDQGADSPIEHHDDFRLVPPAKTPRKLTARASCAPRERRS